jgi:hypothetical protein
MNLIDKLDALFHRAPVAGKLALAPVLGFIFIMFLPVLGFFLTAAAIVTWVVEKFKTAPDAAVDARVPTE